MPNGSTFAWKIAGLAALAVIVLSVPLHALKESRSRAAWRSTDPSPAEFVGREACIGCHEEADQAWLGSDHDAAMAVASDSTVLGDFDDVGFDDGKISARFYKRDGKYFVHASGPEGEPVEYEITHTIGIDPLQQYLIPMSGGRLQAFPVAWDTESGRWFNLYPNSEIPPNDWRHWTQGGQNWNGMCAECHSTDVVKRYDFPSRTYSTTWSEIDVSCEACHGPGSLHVAWAEVPAMARVAAENYELLINTSNMSAKAEVELCAPCHSHRVELGDYDHTQTDLLETLVPSLLTEDLYFADGQILGEVYDYGSFVQSKMYQEGVRCGDCHDIHSLELIEDGNALCLRCHRPNTYDVYEHHFHRQTHRGEPSDGALCVKCHMPETPFMLIDRRADHSLQVPRPDLTLEIGVPNACGASGCHDDRSVQWSADHFRRWYGEAQPPHYGLTLAAAREKDPEAQADLVAMAGDTLYPPIVRATAISLLNSYPGAETKEAFRRALSDAAALVRLAAAKHVNAQTTTELADLLAPLLVDAISSVRFTAAVRLAGSPAGLLQDYQREALDGALLEFAQAMERSLDLPFAGFNLGNLYLSLRDTAAAEPYYRAAFEIDDSFYPAKMNLAVLLNARGEHEEVEALLRDVLADDPNLHEVEYALAMALVDMGSHQQAADHLRRASQAMPERSRVHYELGRLEQLLGRNAAAETALLKALQIEPDNLDYLYALASQYVASGNFGRALQVADRMIAAHPDSDVGPQVKIQVEWALQPSRSEGSTDQAGRVHR
ncbi:MAG: tetratricopeptide repeat protein [Gemmatimonadales bacterium]|jgi:tetratricopeptide (TPR) repeat protein